MTCIVGLAENGVTYLGGDALAGNLHSGEITTRKDPKVFEKGDGYVLGFTTSYRFGDILQFTVPPPEPVKGMKDLRSHLVRTWIPTLRETLLKSGRLMTENGIERSGSFIIGYKGLLCCVYDDFQVGVPNDDYCAVGIGTPYALGSLYTSQGMALSPQNRLMYALKAAAHNNGFVCEPFTIIQS